MGSNISNSQRKAFEEYIKQHPIPDDFDPDLFDGEKGETENAALAYALKKCLKRRTEKNASE